MTTLTTLLAQHPFASAVGLLIIMLTYLVWFLVLAVLLALTIKLCLLWFKLTGRLLVTIHRFMVWGHFALQAYLKAVGLYNLAWSLAQRSTQPPWADIEALIYQLGDYTVKISKHRLAVALGKVTPEHYAASVVREFPPADAAKLRAKLA